MPLMVRRGLVAAPMMTYAAPESCPDTIVAPTQYCTGRLMYHKSKLDPGRVSGSVAIIAPVTRSLRLMLTCPPRGTLH